MYSRATQSKATRLTASLFLSFFALLVWAAPQAHAQSQGDKAYASLQRELGVIANGFENAWKRDDVQLATRLYDLEARSLEHIRRVGNQRVSTKRGTDLGAALALSRRIFQLNQTLWERAVVKIQKANPGEPMAQLVGQVVDRYRPLDRSGAKRRGGPNPKAAVREAKEASDATSTVLDQSFIDSLPEVARATWVRDGSTVKISEDPKAKHLALSDGKDLNGAGDSFIIKNKRGEVLLAVVQDTSGSFKTGPASTEFVRQVFTEELGIPANRVTATFSRPGSAGLVNLLLRVKKIDGDIADERQAKLEKKVLKYRESTRDIGKAIGRARPTDTAKLLKQTRASKSKRLKGRLRTAANAKRARMGVRRKSKAATRRSARTPARRR